MPAITAHQSSETTKLLLIGDSGTGKTGSLASLAAAGYNLRIIDLDNGLDLLTSYLTSPKSTYVQNDPKVAERVRFVTCVDNMRNSQGRLVPSSAKAWKKAVDALAHWKEEDCDLGPLTSWGSNDVLVIDSLTMLSKAAMNFHLSMNSALGANRTGYEGQRDIGQAQNMIRSLLEMLYDPAVKCNVIVTAHITFVSEAGVAPKPDEKTGEASVPGQGYPSSIGRALSPHIPRYFNSMLIVRAEGAGASTRRKLYTQPQVIGTQMVMSKTSAPLLVQSSYPIETGLADYFKAVRG